MRVEETGSPPSRAMGTTVTEMPRAEQSARSRVTFPAPPQPNVKLSPQKTAAACIRSNRMSSTNCSGESPQKSS